MGIIQNPQKTKKPGFILTNFYGNVSRTGLIEIMKKAVASILDVPEDKVKVIPETEKSFKQYLSMGNLKDQLQWIDIRPYLNGDAVIFTVED